MHRLDQDTQSVAEHSVARPDTTCTPERVPALPLQCLIGFFHIPLNLVVKSITAHRKPPEVRIWRLRNQSRVGAVPPLECGFFRLMNNAGWIALPRLWPCASVHEEAYRLDHVVRRSLW